MDKHSLNRLLIVAHALILAVLALLLFAGSAPWLTLLIMAAVVSIVLLYLRKNLRRHYGLISEVARRIAGGDHSQRIPALELDEFDLLGRDLNQMLGTLDATINHLAVHREELRLVLASIEDVLWSQNYEGGLEWANKPFRRLFPAYDARRKQMFWEVIRDPDLQRRIEGESAQTEKLHADIILDGHYYMLSVSRNDQARRKVFILHNIDAIQQASQMKKDFIVNLAHELRTPLTAIRGFADAMRSAPGADHTRYLTIIQGHTLRLIHLVRDLEQLIRLESGAQMDKQDINLETFFANIRLILEPDCAEKRLTLDIVLAPNLPRLGCDPFKLEQVFINLVQNSLRYTETGGIRISAEAAAHAIRFQVSDTGRGIAPEHLPRIFERFYVADPSRNKRESGTGLGLAIVKHIVMLHRGEVSVQSTPGQGTTFTLELPLSEKAGDSSGA